MERITELSNEEAKDFFLEGRHYFSLELPLYFTFGNLLQEISNKLGDKKLSDFWKDPPESVEDVNYKIFNNKDGKYAWRLLQLIHPAIYVSLVNEITEKNNWQILTKRLEKLKNENYVECLSMPIKSEDEKTEDKQPYKRALIKNWLQEVEQKSISLALDFDCLLHTDIIDCYGSIYTHSISWAIHTKEEAKEDRSNEKLIGVSIDKHLQRMSDGQTNGIPQGSVLMDFIAEIVLAYVDNELTKKIKKDIDKGNKFKILRYRDDYRIFVHNPLIGEVIIKNLTYVLAEVGMRLSPEKTKFSRNVVYGSIKEDKLFLIQNHKHSRNIQKELLIINNFADKHPNSGQLIKLLNNLSRRIEKLKNTHQNIESMISILVNIAYKNPMTYPMIASILSKFLSLLSDDTKKIEILKKITRKFSTIPHTEYLDLWLQRITITMNHDTKYKGFLCQKVTDNDKEIWNSEWLNPSLLKIIKETEIIDRKELKELSPIIQEKEVALYPSKYDF